MFKCQAIHLATNVVIISQDLGVVPALAHKVQAAHNVGVVTVAGLNRTLQVKATK